MFIKKIIKYVEALNFCGDDLMNASAKLINLYAKQLGKAHFALVFFTC